MMNFSEDAVFNLTQIDNEKINKNVAQLVVPGEETVLGVFKTVRDQVVFTDKRIMTVDVQGITGKRQEIFTIPYNKIQYFGIQTVGFMELIPDAEIELSFTDGKKAKFEFKGRCDILKIGQMISKYALK